MFNHTNDNIKQMIVKEFVRFDTFARLILNGELVKLIILNLVCVELLIVHVNSELYIMCFIPLVNSIMDSRKSTIGILEL